jgi:pimeloyl-ACP methyl ester carboxylesterase
MRRSRLLALGGGTGLAGAPGYAAAWGADARRRRGCLGELARRDAVRAYVVPVVGQAVEEFPAALSQVREQLAVANGHLGLVGGSLGGMVVLQILTEAPMPIAVAALVNPAVRARSVVDFIEDRTGQRYSRTAQAHKAVDQLDFVARARGYRGPRTPTSAVSAQWRAGLPGAAYRRSAAARRVT